MTRGEIADVGTEHVQANGYIMVKTKEGWKYKHHIIVEKKLKRPLEDERVVFIDGDRTNLDPKNLKVVKVRRGHTKDQLLKSRLLRLEAQHKQMGEEIEALWEEVRNGSASEEVLPVE